MKWYFAINEEGTKGGLGMHARLAVASARHVGGLTPILLYLGARNDFTRWMESHDVTIIETEPTFADVIRAEAAADRYPLAFMGHWLRSRICLIEQDDPFVLYTDCDVVFRTRPDLDAVRPALFACAPEFRPDAWSYFNSGAMVINVEAMRADFPTFERFVIDGLRQPDAAGKTDQEFYNAFYQDRWTRMDPRLNWKTYWPPDPLASIIHVHGPKLDAVQAIMQDRWPWDSVAQRQQGTLFRAFVWNYVAHLSDLRKRIPDIPPDAADLMDWIVANARRFDREAPRERIDANFLTWITSLR